ncbi:hypothetical protein FNV43_RR11557 [Rhamnella rubrinervis]|uniref:Uncharacterized protein n=1 Tax=Rhamnella rubrinervis TaxID=2594499 RepID=A0A8K0MHZ2_9ROSA|nr:hypothetical protein FNV43_RR11557 [Rhamnella rubrinervis]
MKPLCFFLLALAVLFSHTSLTSSSSPSSSQQLFETWCEQYGKSYPSEEEELYRFSVFQDNLAYVAQHNNMGNSSYTLSLNAFADLTHHEFKTSRLGLSPAIFKSKMGPKMLLNGDTPSSVDWRKQGAVTNVKDQGSCGACWSFSATGAIEGINKIVTGSLVSLSEQELVDCDRSYNSGCEGGLMDYAYQFVIDNHGIDSEEDYPYMGRDKSCNKGKLNRHVVTIDGYRDVPESNENQLQQAVASQPVSAGISGGGRAFQLYSKGIFNGPCSTSLDHAVLIVGYGSENGVDYWIVKNSWGKQWGMDGYIHVQRNNGNSQGVCGINMLASYPTKTGQNPPPSPPPGPTRCNLFTQCGEGETCCCGRRILGICFSWKCCGLSSAVCCKDNRHCCPHDYPICDTARSQCLKHTRNATTMQALENTGSSAKSGMWSYLTGGWIL